MPFGKKNSKNSLEKPGKASRWKNAIMTATIAVAGLFASCDGHYSYVNGEFEENPDNPKEVRGRFNIHFDHSESSAGSNTDQYDINVDQSGTGYIVKINGEDKYKVGSLKEAEHKICELISEENEGFVHDKYIKKASKKTAKFMEKYAEYQSNPNRPKKRTVSLKNDK